MPVNRSTSATDARDIGATPYQYISLASTNATVVKATGGVVTSVVANNINAAVRYLKFYDKATAPTVGTDTPVHTIAMPAASVQNITFAYPLGFTNGIAFAITSGVAVADTGAVSANETVLNLGYA